MSQKLLPLKFLLISTLMNSSSICGPVEIEEKRPPTKPLKIWRPVDKSIKYSKLNSSKSSCNKLVEIIDEQKKAKSSENKSSISNSLFSTQPPLFRVKYCSAPALYLIHSYCIDSRSWNPFITPEPLIDNMKLNLPTNHSKIIQKPPHRKSEK